MFKSKEEQFDFYWKEIFTGLAYNPIEFNTYRFDQTMSLPGKVNKLYDMFKVLAMNNQEVMDYLKEFVETFDVKLYETIDDILSKWLEDGILTELIRNAINEEVVEARNDYSTLKERLDSENTDINTRLAQTNAQLAHIVIDVRSFGAHDRREKGFENFDSSDAIQAAHDSDEEGYVYLSGQFNVGKSIGYKKPMKGSVKQKSVLYSTITNGDPVILINDKDYWQLDDFVIRGQQNNCSGIHAINGSSWYHMSNVDVSNCGLFAFDLHGWGGVVNDCHAIKNGGDGWRVREANGGKYTIMSDANGGIGVVLDRGDGVELNVLSEGNTEGGMLVESGIGVVLNAPYFEANFGYQLKVGYNDIYVNNLVINGGVSTNHNKDNEGGFLFDKVNGLTINGTVMHCQSGNVFESTLNSRNIKLNIDRPVYGYIHDRGNSLKKAYNYFPNPEFEHWFSGWGNVSSGKNNWMKETGLVRTGEQALKVQTQVGERSGFALELPQKTFEAIKGKKLVFGAWVYVPDLSTDFANDYEQPTVGIVTQSGDSTPNPRYIVKGKWNFITNKTTPLEIKDSDTSCIIRIYPHTKPDGSATGQEFIIVDSIYVCEDERVSESDLLIGNVTNHHTLPTIQNRNIELYNDVAPTNISRWRNNIFKQGDKIINTTPVSGEPVGWVCVSDSNNDIGSWKGYGIIEP